MAAHGRRPGDLVARYGGEEFAVILSRTDAAGARQVGERIRRAVEALGIAHPASPTARHVTVSLGGASLVIDAETAPADLIAAADQALYAAKHTGRNRVVVETE
jgi:two-component system chemotaxis family response regulator WspR